MEWFVLRDLKRPNSNTPAYKTLPALGFEVFTPMHTVIRETSGKRERLSVPYISNLLFVHASRPDLDPVINRTETLQYRYVKGAAQNTPMTVPTAEMERFINAVSNSRDVTYYAPSEITPDMVGRKVQIVGGNLDGTTGKLLKMRGSKKKRLIIMLEGLISAVIEVEQDYIQFI